MKIVELTEPEFAVHISKSSFVVVPVAVEIHAAVLASLKNLEVHEAEYNVRYIYK